MEINEFDKIIESIKALKKQVDKINTTPPTLYQSEIVKDLYAALAKAQAEMPLASPTKVNTYFKSNYADLGDFIKATRPALSKHGLCVTQAIIVNDEGQNILNTVLGHSTGQWISSHMRIVPPKSDIQTLGSHITYLRRFAYTSLVGAVGAGDDDDGELSVHPQRQETYKGTKINTKYDPRKESYETITKEQIDEIEYEINNYPDLVGTILESLKIQTLADVPKSRFRAVIKRAREIVALREGKEVL